MRRSLFALFALVLASCGGGSQVADFSNRAVFYTWIDASGVPGNRMTDFQVRNLSDPGPERFYKVGYEKLGSGYLVWHNGVLPGRYEFHKMWLMTCAGPLCTNTINEFTFGRPGAGIGGTNVANPGVFFAGCYALKRTKRGFFRPGEFDTRPSKCGVSKAAMLNVMLKSAKDPVVQSRIRSAM